MFPWNGLRSFHAIDKKDMWCIHIPMNQSERRKRADKGDGDVCSSKKKKSSTLYAYETMLNQMMSALITVLPHLLSTPIGRIHLRITFMRGE